MTTTLRCTVVAIATFLIAQPISASAADLKVFTIAPFSDVWAELKPKFEATGHKLDLIVAPAVIITKRVTDGEIADAVLSTGAGIETLTRNGKVIADTATQIANSGLAVAVLKGMPKPDISTPEKLKQALLAAKAVAYADPAAGGASGVLFAKVLDQLGIATEVNAKAKLGRGVPAGGFVVRGEADIAIQQLPELLAVQGIEVVGPLPSDLQTLTPFAAGVPVNSPHPDAGRALIKFLQTPEAIGVIKAKGMNPPAAAKSP